MLMHFEGERAVMSTTISILGGVGLFLLGMTVMTEGLKALAGSSLRTVLGKAAATPLSGAFWGAVVTLLVQSSSATTMTTIGLVSAGLLTFPQGLGLVFGANVGTTGTGWLVALIGVRVSLSSYALPLIFVGALVKLLGRGRISAAGAALAGFALVLFGLTTLQQGMGGLAESLHPSDLPAVLGAPGVGWLSGSLGVDQGCALIIGQNIGTATSSAMAAIGASTTAKRLAVAYILFKVIAALIALVLFPITIPLIVRAASATDGVTLLAAYHTAYNVVGVAVLMPAIGWFTRLVERLLPDRTSPLTRSLDPAALATPVAAVEAVRRTVARAIQSICDSVNATLAAASNGGAVNLGESAASVKEAADALEKALEFMSDVSGPPETDDEQRRVTSTLHALDHATRLAEIAGEAGFKTAKGGPEDARAAELCADAMQNAASVARDVVAESTSVDNAASIETRTKSPGSTDAGLGIDAPAALVRLEKSARALSELRLVHRSATLSAVATGSLTAD